MCKLARTLLLAGLFAWNTVVAAATSEEAERQLRVDCQIEGQAGGLGGKDQNDFIESCVAELLGIDYVNVTK